MECANIKEEAMDEDEEDDLVDLSQSKLLQIKTFILPEEMKSDAHSYDDCNLRHYFAKLHESFDRQFDLINQLQGLRNNGNPPNCEVREMQLLQCHETLNNPNLFTCRHNFSPELSTPSSYPIFMPYVYPPPNLFHNDLISDYSTFANFPNQLSQSLSVYGSFFSLPDTTLTNSSESQNKPKIHSSKTNSNDSKDSSSSSKKKSAKPLNVQSTQNCSTKPKSTCKGTGDSQRSHDLNETLILSKNNPNNNGCYVQVTNDESVSENNGTDIVSQPIQDSDEKIKAKSCAKKKFTKSSVVKSKSVQSNSTKPKSTSKENDVYQRSHDLNEDSVSSKNKKVTDKKCKILVKCEEPLTDNDPDILYKPFQVSVEKIEVKSFPKKKSTKSSVAKSKLTSQRNTTKPISTYKGNDDSQRPLDLNEASISSKSKQVNDNECDMQVTDEGSVSKNNGNGILSKAIQDSVEKIEVKSYPKKKSAKSSVVKSKSVQSKSTKPKSSSKENNVSKQSHDLNDAYVSSKNKKVNDKKYKILAKYEEPLSDTNDTNILSKPIQDLVENIESKSCSKKKSSKPSVVKSESTQNKSTKPKSTSKEYNFQQSHDLNEASTSSKIKKVNEKKCNMQITKENPKSDNNNILCITIEDSEDSEDEEKKKSKSNDSIITTNNGTSDCATNVQLLATSSLLATVVRKTSTISSSHDKSQVLTQLQFNNQRNSKENSSNTVVPETDLSTATHEHVLELSSNILKSQSNVPLTDISLENRDPRLRAKMKLFGSSSKVNEQISYDEYNSDPTVFMSKTTDQWNDKLVNFDGRAPLRDSNVKMKIQVSKLCKETRSLEVSTSGTTTLKDLLTDQVVEPKNDAIITQDTSHSECQKEVTLKKKNIDEPSTTEATKIGIKRPLVFGEQLSISKLPKIPKLSRKPFTIEGVDGKTKEGINLPIESVKEKNFENCSKLQMNKGVKSKPIEIVTHEFNTTQHSMQDILAHKRAVRERVKGIQEVKVTPHVENVKRMFGKGFSPTIYTPEKCPLKQILVEETIKNDRDLFLQALLYNHTNDLSLENDDECITAAIKFIYEKFNFNLKENREAPLSYQSLQDYKAHFTPLVIYDVWTQICRASRNQSLETIDVTMTSMVEEHAWMTLAFKGYVSNTRLYDTTGWTVTLTQEKERGSVLGFVEKQLSINQIQPSTYSDPKITRTGHRSLFQFIIRVSQKHRQSIDNRKHFQIRLLFYLRPSLRIIETLARMEDRSDFIKSILLPELNDSLPNPISNFTFLDQDQYNQYQQEAIVRCYHVIQQRYTYNKTVMIQGPPGTGKTHTIVGIVKNMFYNHEHNGEKPLRILICAPSNGAIDEIGRRLINIKEFPRRHPSIIKKLRLVRIGIKEQVHPDVRDYQLDSLIENNFRKGFHREHLGPDRHKLVRDDIITKADVILSTLQSCQQACMQAVFKKESSKLAIRCLIVDEASQCVEPEILMPLIYKSISKVILIGDHCQLPPTVISRKATKLSYGRSMFERFYEKMHQEYSKQPDKQCLPITTLKMQFRMKYEICSFPSKQFYESALRTAPNSGVNPKIPLRSYFVFDLYNTHERNAPSKSNEFEVEFVIKLLRSILRVITENNGDMELDEPPLSIGVITFYRSQCEAIDRRVRQLLSRQVVPSISMDVNTVDAFQGQERDVVILSCVRAFDPSFDHSIGFVQSQQRLNVAITRARSALYICLDGKSFLDNSCWQSLLTDAQSRKRYLRTSVSIPDENLKRKISN